MTWNPAPVADDILLKNFVKLRIDRLLARGAVRERLFSALGRDRLLVLVSAGGPSDWPDWLMDQVWDHYDQQREPGSPVTHPRLRLNPEPLPDPDELRNRLTRCLTSEQTITPNDWRDGVDLLFAGLERAGYGILSLEWHLPPRPPEISAEAWRKDWLKAWRGLCLELAGYQRDRVLLVSALIVKAEDGTDPGDWTRDEDAGWDALGAGLPAGLIPVALAPLSLVEQHEIKEFLRDQYRLHERCPDLAAPAVAQWVFGQTGGDFDKTVRLVEELLTDGFERYRGYLKTRQATTPEPR